MTGGGRGGGGYSINSAGKAKCHTTLTRIVVLSRDGNTPYCIYYVQTPSERNTGLFVKRRVRPENSQRISTLYLRTVGQFVQIFDVTSVSQRSSP